MGTNRHQYKKTEVLLWRNSTKDHANTIIVVLNGSCDIGRHSIENAVVGEDHVDLDASIMGNGRSRAITGIHNTYFWFTSGIKISKSVSLIFLHTCVKAIESRKQQKRCFLKCHAMKRI